MKTILLCIKLDTRLDHLEINQVSGVSKFK